MMQACARRHHGRAPTYKARIIPAVIAPRQLRKQPKGPSPTITVTGFEGFEGSGHAIAVMPAPFG
jgi:hypothetical protein